MEEMPKEDLVDYVRGDMDSLTCSVRMLRIGINGD